ncbi:MAG TPA: proton-conducting transporter membrane subunit [Halanaerobiales bacterium]|nr:proton-conducting transporter membrane subunit [Halanaerobiales bacterium]
MSIALILLIIVPLATAILIPFVDVFSNTARKLLVGFSTLVEFSLGMFIIVSNFRKIMDNTFYLTYYLGEWIPPIGITLSMDMLSLFFSTLISFSLLFLVIYSIGFIGHHEGKYYVLLFLIWAAMHGIVLTGDIFNLDVFLELLLITSAPLVAFKRNRNGTEAAIKYMFYGTIGGLFIFIGVVLVYYNLGTLNFADISQNFNTLSLFVRKIIASFFLIGIFIKMGIFPFHFWLSKAHSACPSSISALLSGVIVKVYVYVFIRLFWNVIGFDVLVETGLDHIILVVALISSIIGHIMALYENDIKRTLAYSTIANLGMIIAVLTLNTKLALLAGLLHVLAHLLMKVSLFTATGYILQFTPGHKREDLKGVAYKNMLVFVGFIIVAGGMIGLPPMIGFASKWYVLKAFMTDGLSLAAVIIIIGSIFAFVYYIKYIITGFKKMTLGPPDKFRLILTVFYRERVVTDIALFFAIAVLISGIFFKVVFGPIEGAVEVIQNPSFYIDYILSG